MHPYKMPASQWLCLYACEIMVKLQGQATISKQIDLHTEDECAGRKRKLKPAMQKPHMSQYGTRRTDSITSVQLQAQLDNALQPSFMNMANHFIQ